MAFGAARECLRQASIAASEIDVIIDVRSVAGLEDAGEPLPVRLAASQAYVVTMVGSCSICIAALKCATAWLASRQIRRVLIVYAEKLRWGSYRCAERISEEKLKPLFSDGAAAVLVERGGDLALRGFGFAGRNDDMWPALQASLTTNADPRTRPELNRPDLAFALATAPFVLAKDAFDRCVVDCGSSFSAGDRVVLPAVAPIVRARLLHELEAGPTQLTDHDGPAHLQAGDSLFAIAALWRNNSFERGRRYFIGEAVANLAGFVALERNEARADAARSADPAG
jgi:hypothetical protein